jgi:Reverse transcriptase (RNA-dependent DNA polymerase)
MRRFVLGWQRKGFEARLKARIVTYADDLVICCKDSAAQALEAMRFVMAQIKLTVNEEKTRVCRVPSETFDFLGYTFGRCYSPKTGRAYLGTRPSKKSIRRVIERLHVNAKVIFPTCGKVNFPRWTPGSSFSLMLFPPRRGLPPKVAEAPVPGFLALGWESRPRIKLQERRSRGHPLPGHPCKKGFEPENRVLEIMLVPAYRARAVRRIWVAGRVV